MGVQLHYQPREGHVSVLVLLRVKGDASQVEKMAADDPGMLKTIVDRAKANGLIRHRFFGTNDEIIVVDEWPDEASFQKFFESSPEIPKLLEAAGVKTAPDVTFARELDVNDAVG